MDREAWWATVHGVAKRFNPWAGMILWRREWQPTPVFSPGEFHGQESLAGYSPWSRRESDTTERLSTAQHTTVVYIW